ncbi:MAG: type IV pilin protein [Pseudomonadales bacterium]
MLVSLNHVIKKQRGFTLIELMLVVCIVGVLLTLAVPSYTKQKLKANRSDAYTMLNEIMHAEERFAADNGVYTIDLTAMGYAAPQISIDGHYSVAASVCAGALVPPIAQCVLLTATALGAQLGDTNDVPGTGNIPITLNSRGTKTGW